jgi:hypothetical protein
MRVPHSVTEYRLLGEASYCCVGDILFQQSNDTEEVDWESASSA